MTSSQPKSQFQFISDTFNICFCYSSREEGRGGKEKEGREERRYLKKIQQTKNCYISVLSSWTYFFNSL